MSWWTGIVPQRILAQRLTHRPLATRCSSRHAARGPFSRLEMLLERALQKAFNPRSHVGVDAWINAKIGRYYTRRSDLVDELARGDAADAMRVKQLRRWTDEDRSALVIIGVDFQLERNEAVRRLHDFGG